MSTRKRSVKTVGRTEHGRERLPAQLSQANLNASGIDVGASSHFAAVSQDRSETLWTGLRPRNNYYRSRGPCWCPG